MVYFWLAAMVVFIILEVSTVALVSVWFAAGSLCAMIATMLGASFPVQIIIFIVASAVILALVRPFVKKFINVNRRPTNADRVIGRACRVTETIDNINGTGAVSADGKIWTARSKNGKIIPEGTLIRPVAIEGVKLIVVPVNETVSAGK